MQNPTDAMSKYDVLKDVAWLEQTVFGNTIYAYLLTLASFAVIWLALHFARQYAYAQLQRRADSDGAGDAWRFMRTLIAQIRPYVLPLVAFMLASKRLAIAPALERGLQLVVLAVLTIQVLRLVIELVTFMIMRSRALGRAEDLAAQNTSKNLVVLMRIAVWSGGLLFFLDNAGYNVTAFVTGLGIGGIAIALAAQAVLGDAFSSFAIALDKPFEVGDSIVVDTLSGTVEYIGLKTTRVRSATGELLVFANSDLTRTRIRNFKRMTQRKVTFKLNIHPETPSALLRRVPELLREAVESAPSTRFERAHLATIGDWAFIFEVVYQVTTPEYGAYMDVQQAINHFAHDALGREGIAFAFNPLPGRVTPVER